MNIIVDCDVKQIAEIVGKQIQEQLRLNNYFDFESIPIMSKNQFTGSGQGGCIIIQGPQTMEEYRNLSATSYSPDLIVCINCSSSTRQDNLLRFYEDRVSIFYPGVHDDISSTIIKYINDEIICA